MVGRTDWLPIKGVNIRKTEEAMDDTVMASALIERLRELVRLHGDLPVVLIEPLNDAALPISAGRSIKTRDGRIEIHADI